MNNIFKTVSAFLFAGALLTSCSPDEFKGADQNGIPSLEGMDFDLTIDASTNQMTAAVTNLPKGAYPIWYLDTDGDGDYDGADNTDQYSTLQSISKVFAKKGTYNIMLKIGNRNGFSTGGIEKSFTIENDMLDEKTLKQLCDKQWRIDYSKPAHMGCGEPGTDGTGWWSAAPNDKADWGVYDDRISFTMDGAYTYNPGEGGTVYVNTGCSIFSEFNTNDGNDFMATVAEQTTRYEIVMEGSDRYLVLSANTLFPYISADGQYANPRFRIEDLTSKQMVLVYEGDGINWHFILTSTDDVPAEEPSFKGYKYDSPCNKWLSTSFTMSYFYAHGDGWESYPDGSIGFTDNGNGKYNVSLPYESNIQWQAQVVFHTDMVTNAVTNYDFSVKFTSNSDAKGVTVKLTSEASDDVYYFADRIDLKADETYIFYYDNMQGLDIDAVKFVLDFGGVPAGTEVEVAEIVLKEHDCDDGAGHPSDEPADNTPYAYDTEDNLWKAVDATECEMFFYYAHGDGWESYPEAPGFVHNGNAYTITLPGETNMQWQAQVAFLTNLSCGEAEVYDFGCIMTPNTDLKNVTVKLVMNGDDNTYFFANSVNLEADTENVIKFPAQVAPAAMPRISLFFDFGGNPADTEIVVKDIVFKKTAQ